MNRVIIVVNRTKPNAETCLKHIRPVIEDMGGNITGIDMDMSYNLANAEADMIIVIGGDGTILSAARRLNGNAIPVFGINIGHLGFLAQTSPQEAAEKIKQIYAGDYIRVSRLMLRIHSVCDTGACSYICLNDVVLKNHESSKFLMVDASVNNQNITTYKGDGIIISTPTGSTGYSLSSGGPIAERSMDAIILTPICAHTLTVRPLVLEASPGKEVTLNIRDGSEESALIIDGEMKEQFNSEATITIRAYEHRFSMIYPGKTSEFAILSEKLGWGGSL